MSGYTVQEFIFLSSPSLSGPTLQLKTLDFFFVIYQKMATNIVEDVDVFPTFASMGLKENLIHGIFAKGKLKNHHFLKSTSEKKN